MAVGRISGPLLKKNLTREGVDLAFETDLLYLDVNNGRIGVKTSSPSHTLTIDGTSKTTDLEVTTQADLATFTITGNTIASSSDTINLTPSGTDPVVYQGTIVVDDVEITGNTISTTGTNTDLNITTVGTGKVNVNANLEVTGDIHATGTITADGNIQLGNADTDNIVFQGEVNSDIVPDQHDTYKLGTTDKKWQDVYVVNLTADTVTAGGIVVDGIDLALRQGNLFYVSENGNDSNSGTHENDPFLTVSYALSQATSGDTVYIYPGTYSEEFPLTVPAGVTVRGASLRAVKIVPTPATAYNDAFLLNGDTTVEDITVADFYGTTENTITLENVLNNPTAYSTSATDYFGYSVAISGNYAIVGAYLEDNAGNSNSGKAYIFDVTTGSLLHALDNPNAYSASAGDYFGYSVGISGNYAIVGAYQEDDAGGSNSGKAYIFDVTTGSLLHTLDNPNAYSTSAGDYFGNAVGISGNYAIVGAYQEDDAGGSNSGKAYIFNVTTGTLIHTLNNPNAYFTSLNDGFGNAVAISSNYAIVGATGEDDSGGSNSGKAYIFDVTTGSLLHTLNNPNAYSTSDSDFFGISVAIDDDYAIVGTSYEDDASGVQSGKAYIFNVTTGTLIHTLDNPNAYSTSYSDYFGTSVAISGTNVVVSAYLEDDAGGNSSGKAYVFSAVSGQLLHTLDNPTAYSTSDGDSFGNSVAISGTNVVVGAYLEDDAGGNSSGKAYTYNLSGTIESGYAFRFAPGASITARSPYIRNVTVLTKGSVTSSVDPLGFDAGNAGKGALVDGSVLDPSSKEAGMLFHAVTFITPGVDCITTTNGARIEWLNSFTYYANKGIYAYSGSTGFAGVGKTKLRIDNRTGTWAVGNTLTYYDTDRTTVLASGVISSIDGNYVYLTGKYSGFQTITDRSGKTVYANGDAKLSTSFKKFGASSLALDGTGDYANISTNPDFEFGTDDFCIEAWVYPTTTGVYRTLFDLRSSSGDTGGIILGISDANAVYFFYNGNYRVGPVGTVAVGAWTHVALARVSGSTKVFVNGTQVGSTYADSNTYAERAVRIGADPNGSYAFAGYIDDVRISKGVGRYSSNFTAPTAALTGDLSTVLLLHFNGTNNSTIFLDDGVTLQDLRTSASGTASLINFADYSDFGAEIRSIGSANIYGNYGTYGDGEGVVAYLISQNYAYVGSGKLSTNDPNDRIEANEVVKLNNAKIYYTSVDNEGNFSVGDAFYVNQKTGEVLFNNQSLSIVAPDGVVFSDGVNTTTLLPGEVTTGNIKISGNTVESLTGDVNVVSASGEINLQNNTNISGDLDVTGNVTIGGNIQIGDETTDTVSFVAGISSNLVPATTNTYDLGTTDLRWNNLYLSGNFNTAGDVTASGNVTVDGYMQLSSIRISGNTVETTATDTDLKLLANGTGNVVIEGLQVNTNNIQSTGTNADITITPTGTGIVNINSTQSLKIPVGTTLERPGTPTSGMIRYNTTMSRYEGWNGSYWIALGNLQDVDGNTYITPELTPGANDNTIRFYADGNLMVTIDSTKLFAERLQTNNLDIVDNTISAIATDSDINLTTTGTGSVKIGNLAIRNNTISNTVNNAITEFVETGTGYIKVAGTNGVVIPFGDTISRPSVVETGMMRFNTETEIVEIYNGVSWTTVAGTSTGVNFTDATNIGIETALTFG